MRKVLNIVLAVACFTLTAQDYKVNKINGTRVGTVDPSSFVPDYNAQIRGQEMPNPDGDSYKDFLMRQKIESRKQYPLKPGVSTNKTNSFADRPIIGRQTPTYRVLPNGNVVNVNAGIPNDNSMAISNDGILVSGFNSSIWAYDYNTDTTVFPFSIISLQNMSGVSTPGGNYYDPKLIYDPDADRFILVFLKDNSPSNSRIFICFSSTNDPNDPWYSYSLPGNPLNNNRWTDYPAVSLTDKEVFITANLIVPGVSWQIGFDGSLIWQINKEDGYNNAAQITSTLYSQIEYDGQFTRNVHPVRGARGIAEKQYFMSNRNFDITNDTVFVMHLTGTQEDPTTELKVTYGITDVPYGMPPNGQQADTDLNDPTSGLQTNDARVLGGFLLDDRIQFVANTVNPATGRAGFYHGSVEKPSSENPEIKGQIIGSDTLDYGYPNIAFTGQADCDLQAIIGFDFSSMKDHPGVGAIYYNNDGEYSDLQILTKGETFVNRLGPPTYSDGYERWGDYFGIQSKFNSPGKVYTTGYYVRASGRNSTWVTELFSPDTISTGGGGGVAGEQKVFPNPTGIYEDINVQFNVTEAQDVSAYIYDLNGRLIDKIVERKDCVGSQILSFSTAPLPDGMYVVKIYGERGNEIMKEKFIKN